MEIWRHPDRDPRPPASPAQTVHSHRHRGRSGDLAILPRSIHQDPGVVAGEACLC